MKKTSEQIEQEKYELRIISRELQREEALEALKKKHLISGTIEEQKMTVLEKSEALEMEAEDQVEDPIEDTVKDPVEDPIVEEEHANTIRDTQQSEEGLA